MSKFVKLPNGRVTAVDEAECITAMVEVPLSEFIDNDLGDILSILSESATGSDLMSDIGYSVAGYNDNTLILRVSGGIESIDVEEINEADVPMQEFEATVTRIGYGSRTINLSARTAEEARDIADDDAGNHTYNEHTAEYLIEVRPLAEYSVDSTPGMS